jgi:membrane-associated HD superfamily phosphohydrolase
MKPTVDTKMEEIPDTDIRSLQEAIPSTKANNAREQHTVNLEHQVEELKRKNEANAALVEAMTVAERRMVTELETTRSQLRIANQTIAQVQAAVGMYTVPKISDMRSIGLDISPESTFVSCLFPQKYLNFRGKIRTLKLKRSLLDVPRGLRRYHQIF